MIDPSHKITRACTNACGLMVGLKRWNFLTIAFQKEHLHIWNAQMSINIWKVCFLEKNKFSIMIQIMLQSFLLKKSFNTQPRLKALSSIRIWIILLLQHDRRDHLKRSATKIATTAITASMKLTECWLIKFRSIISIIKFGLLVFLKNYVR